MLNAERESGYGVDFKTLDDGNPLAQRYVFPNLSFQRGGGRLLSSRYDNFRRVVIAPAGIGKTSLLKAVMLHYAQNLPGLGEQLGAALAMTVVLFRRGVVLRLFLMEEEPVEFSPCGWLEFTGLIARKDNFAKRLKNSVNEIMESGDYGFRE